MPVRNEEWCLGLSLRVALMWCDALAVHLHSCRDSSWDIAEEIQKEYGEDRILLSARLDPLWDEMRDRQFMFGHAREHGATHIAIVDADEILTGNLLPRQYSGMPATEGVRAYVDAMIPGYILQLPLYNLRHGITQYHSNGIWGNRIVSLAFADDPRLQWAGDRFHAREPQGAALTPYRPIQQGQGGVVHLWGASERRLRAKHALYKLTERLRWSNKPVQQIDDLYSLAIKPREPWTFASVPEAWWKPYEQWMKYLDVDAEPWQEAECRRLVAEHGREKFAGLDLFDVV